MTRDEIMKLEGVEFDRAVAEAMGIEPGRSWYSVDENGLIFRELYATKTEEERVLALSIDWRDKSNSRNARTLEKEIYPAFSVSAAEDYRVLEWVRENLPQKMEPCSLGMKCAKGSIGDYALELDWIWAKRHSVSTKDMVPWSHRRCLYQPGDYGRALLLAKAEVAK